ncbi:hypothetical protein [Budvicia aquatica]|uniref:hypothetical protein n=1 Tax=Budvicia aquatica TaxID=82979 RepID=UPI00207E017C|nr:hypothetical protein [Budvicia aquatica]GKX51306.1 hypothetical protein SOASR029_16150 [Budvicia aquatica]
MDIEEENKRLSQIQHIDKFKKKHKATDMVTVYFSKIHDSYNRGIYSVLVPINSAEKILSKYEWSFQGYEGKPNTEIFCYEGDDKEYIEYLRFGNFDEMEPLIICHDGIALSEEFRLFHKLYYDKKSSNYFQRDDDGNQTIIVKFSQEKIEIRLKELKQFLAVKDKYLLVQFDFIEYSQCLLEDIDPINTDVQIENLMTYRIGLGDMPFCCDGLNTISRLLGKYLIEPYPKEQSDFGDYKIKKIKQCCDFIIDVDDFGQEIILNANVSSLDYLTRVCFRKKVLDKYYSEPSKYSVEESYLRAVDLWGIQIDNHHDDKVYVWLGDLGRDLSYEEQLYWRSFNIPPEGKMSKEFIQQQIMAVATDSENLTHKFKRQYKALQKICNEILGNNLLLPLVKDDEHYIDSLRIPANDEQKHFDEQILSLTKVLIDSLNEKYLNTFLNKEQLESVKGSIARLEATLTNCNIANSEKHILFLKELQGLRSTGVAHRKGNSYQKITQKFDLENNNLQGVFSKIIKQAVYFLEFLYEQVEQNNFMKKIDLN